MAGKEDGGTAGIWKYIATTAVGLLLTIGLGWVYTIDSGTVKRTEMAEIKEAIDQRFRGVEGQLDEIKTSIDTLRYSIAKGGNGG